MAADYDVVVVGAGPAGCSAALAAVRRGASVLLLDREAFPRDKACGDGIAPQAVAELEALGVTGVTGGYPPVPVLEVVGPGGGRVSRPLPAAAHTVPRTVFDERLLRAAVDAGATFRHHRVRRVRDHGTVVEVDDVVARAVVGADGATSIVRRHLGAAANPPGHLALAIRGYAPATDAAAGGQRIVMSDRNWPAYAWSFPIGDGRRNVGYGELLRGGTVTRAHLLERLAALLPDVDLGATGALRAHHLPLSTRRPPPGRGRLLLAGDALSLINPFTGEGIFYAVASGALAGAAAATGAPDAGRRYARAFHRRLGRHLRHTGFLARLAGRSWLADAGVQAARRRQPVFDTLVELGLGDGLVSPRLLTSVAAGVRMSPTRR